MNLIILPTFQSLTLPSSITSRLISGIQFPETILVDMHHLPRGRADSALQREAFHE